MSVERFHFEYPEFINVDDELKISMQDAINTRCFKNGVAYQEFKNETNSFGDALMWHTDAPITSGKIQIATSHLPTLFADVVLEFDQTHPHFPQFFMSNPGKTMLGLFDGDWVEKAFDDDLHETNFFGIEVVRVNITQQLPYTLAIGPVGSTLHKSATYVGDQNFKGRAFYRNFW